MTGEMLDGTDRSRSDQGWGREHLAALLERWREVRSNGPGADVRAPIVALIVAAVPLVVGIRTHSITGPISPSVSRSFGWSVKLSMEGDWWRVLTAIPITRDPFMLGGMLFSLVLAVGGLEYLGGRWRAGLTFIYGAIGGYVGVTLITVLLRTAGLDVTRHWAHTLDYGASAGVAACSGAMVAMMRRRSLLIVGLVIIVGGLVLHHQIADWEHAFAFTTSLTYTHATTRDRDRTSLALV